MLKYHLLDSGKNYLARLILELAAQLIIKLNISSLTVEDLFLDQAIASEEQRLSQLDDLDNLDDEENHNEDDDSEQFNEDSTFSITNIYDVLQVSAGTRTFYALCIKVIDKETNRPWWLPYMFLKKHASEEPEM